jgi:membrane associated rhomboid family serine protease
MGHCGKCACAGTQRAARHRCSAHASRVSSRYVNELCYTCRRQKLKIKTRRMALLSGFYGAPVTLGLLSLVVPLSLACMWSQAAVDAFCWLPWAVFPFFGFFSDRIAAAALASSPSWSSADPYAHSAPPHSSPSAALSRSSVLSAKKFAYAKIYTIFTHFLTCRSLPELALTVFALFAFGRQVERLVGSQRMCALLCVCVCVCACVSFSLSCVLSLLGSASPLAMWFGHAQGAGPAPLVVALFVVFVKCVPARVAGQNAQLQSTHDARRRVLWSRVFMCVFVCVQLSLKALMHSAHTCALSALVAVLFIHDRFGLRSCFATLKPSLLAVRVHANAYAYSNPFAYSSTHAAVRAAAAAAAATAAAAAHGGRASRRAAAAAAADAATAGNFLVRAAKRGLLVAGRWLEPFFAVSDERLERQRRLAATNAARAAQNAQVAQLTAIARMADLTAAAALPGPPNPGVARHGIDVASLAASMRPMLRGGPPGGTVAAAADDTVPPPPLGVLRAEDEAAGVDSLVAMGFERAAAAIALRRAEGNLEMAANLLLTR